MMRCDVFRGGRGGARMGDGTRRRESGKRRMGREGWGEKERMEEDVRAGEEGRGGGGCDSGFQGLIKIFRVPCQFS